VIFNKSRMSHVSQGFLMDQEKCFKVTDIAIILLALGLVIWILAVVWNSDFAKLLLTDDIMSESKEAHQSEFYSDSVHNPDGVGESE